MNVKDLEGAKLDYYVAMAIAPQDLHWVKDGKAYKGGYLSGHTPPKRMCGLWWRPSTDWSQGGPLIEGHHIDVGCIGEKGWSAMMWNGKTINDDHYGKLNQYVNHTGKTPLIAAMRALVASKYGYTVEDEV